MAAARRSTPTMALNSDLRSAFLCPLCGNEFNDGTCVPKLLQCHHSCCLACLGTLVNITNEVTCPSCNKLTTVSSGLETLETNSSVSSFRAYVGSCMFSMTRTGMHGADESESNSIWCKECRTLFMASCLDSGHEVLNYDDYVGCLWNECEEQRAAISEKINNLVKMREESAVIARALENMTMKLKDVMEKNERHLPLLLEESAFELPVNDASEEDHAAALSRLENLETCLRTYVEKMMDVWNTAIGKETTFCKYYRQRKGTIVSRHTLKIEDLQHKSFVDCSDEMMVMRYLFIIIDCRNQMKTADFQILPMPNPTEQGNVNGKGEAGASKKAELLDIATGGGGDDPMFCCPTCLNVFHANTCIPKLLVCHHSYCLACLRTLATNNNGSINCPMCRRVTQTSSDLQNLTTNFYVLDFQDYLGRITVNQPTSPKIAEKRDRVWCKKCRNLFMSFCLRNKHEMLHYAEYIDYLKSECHRKRDAALSNNHKLIKIKEDIDATVRALERMTIELKGAAKVNDSCLPYIQKDMKLIQLSLFKVKNKADYTSTLSRLKNLDLSLDPLMHKLDKGTYWYTKSIFSHSKELEGLIKSSVPISDEEMTVLQYLNEVVIIREECVKSHYATYYGIYDILSPGSKSKSNACWE